MRKPFEGDYPVTQTFGNDLVINGAHYYAQWGFKGHDGIDYGLPTGTVVVAPHAGTVIEAAFDAKGYGNYVKIENDKEGSVLGHLEKINVKVGDTVGEGDSLGTSDNTGYSTGPHLHWGFYQKPRDRANGFDGYIDQTPFLTGSSEPVSGQLYTKEQYDAVMTDRNKFWQERDAAIKSNEEMNQKLTDDEAKITAFAAAGYKSVDDVNTTLAPYNELKALNYTTVADVQKVLKGKDDELLGIKTELVQVLDRNKILLEQLQKKESEDSTAIQSGLDALRKLNDLEDKMAKIHISVGLDPKKGIEDLWQIIRKIDFFKKWAQKAIEAKAQPISVQPSPPPPAILNTTIEAKTQTDRWAFLKVLGLLSGIAVGVIAPRLLHLL